MEERGELLSLILTLRPGLKMLLGTEKYKQRDIYYEAEGDWEDLEIGWVDGVIIGFDTRSMSCWAASPPLSLSLPALNNQTKNFLVRDVPLK